MLDKNKEYLYRVSFTVLDKNKGRSFTRKGYLTYSWHLHKDIEEEAGVPLPISSAVAAPHNFFSNWPGVFSLATTYVESHLIGGVKEPMEILIEIPDYVVNEWKIRQYSERSVELSVVSAEEDIEEIEEFML